MNIRPTKAMTLLELLAVVSILGMSTAALVGVVGPISAGQHRLQAINQTREFLDRARLLAETAHSCSLATPVLEVEFGSTLRAHRTGGAQATSLPIAMTYLPRGWVATLSRRNGSPAESNARLRFWSGGWSDDAVIELHPLHATRAAVPLELLGLSGQVTVEGEGELAR